MCADAHIACVGIHDAVLWSLLGVSIETRLNHTVDQPAKLVWHWRRSDDGLFNAALFFWCGGAWRQEAVGAAVMD